MSVLGPLFRWDSIEVLFTDRALVQGMLEFEAALARAESRTGVIPAPAAAAIAGRCSADLYDLAALGRAGASAGNIAIPLVAELTARVEEVDAEAAGFVHWGATSQDAIDTGLVLQLRPALEHIEAELVRLAGALASLAREHRDTTIAGRTWMQHAVPTTFGLKAAGWLDAVERHLSRIAEARSRVLALQLGGAAGTLAALGDKGPEVASALAEDLRLSLPDLPWHAHRDRVAEVATVLGLLAGTLGKMAKDVALHAQTEVAEVLEPSGEGRGGSSSMAHKRNPVSSAVVLAAATRIPALVATMLGAMAQEDERGLGGWQAEWETLPELVRLCGGALHRAAETMAGLRVDAARMAANLTATRGLVFAEAAEMALAARVGRREARRLVAGACRRARGEDRHLEEVLAGDPEVGRHLGGADLRQVFEPGRGLAVAGRLVDGVLAKHAQRAKVPSDER